MARAQSLPRGIYLRGGKYWGDFTDKNLKRHRFCLKTSDRRLALTVFKAEQARIVAESCGLKEKDTTVATFLSGYLETAKALKSEAVFKEDERRLRLFFDFCRDPARLDRLPWVARLEELTPDHFLRFFNWRVEAGKKRVGTNDETGEILYGPIRRSTAAHDLRVVRTALNWAVKRKLLLENPCPNPETFGRDMRRKRIPFMEKEERDRLLLALALPVFYRRGEGAVVRPDEGIVGRPRSTPLYEIAAMAFFTGMRVEEILFLEWENVSFERLEISIVEKPGWKPKDREERTVPIFPELERILRPMKKESGRIFSTRDGEHFSKRNLLRDLQEVARREGVRVENGRLPNWVVTRHTFATQLVSAGVPIFAVSNWLGHSSVVVTERHYAEFVPREALVRQASAALLG